MSKYLVHVDDHMLRNGMRKFTANQWLALTRINPKRDGATRIFNLASPVTVSVQVDDLEKPLTKVCRKSSDVWKMFFKGLIIALRWRGGHVGPNGLYELNQVFDTPQFRKDGISQGGYWLQCQRPSAFLRDDLPRFLAFFEIRPVFALKTAKGRRPFESKTTDKACPTLYIMSNATLDVRSKRCGGKKPPRVRSPR